MGDQRQHRVTLTPAAAVPIGFEAWLPTACDGLPPIPGRTPAGAIPPTRPNNSCFYPALDAGTSPTDKVSIEQLNPRLGVNATAATEFRTRTGRWAPPIAATQAGYDRRMSGSQSPIVDAWLKATGKDAILRLSLPPLSALIVLSTGVTSDHGPTVS